VTTPDDDWLVSMGLESCWVTADAAAALEDAGLCEYGLFQDAEDMSIGDGMVPCAGVSHDEIWEWLRENGSGHEEDQ